MNNEQLINDFERQLKDLYKSGTGFDITFLVQKEGCHFYNIERYDCWGIISKMGSKKFNNWRKVAERALINIRKLYPNEDIKI